MIYEVKYNKKNFNSFEYYVDNVFKINFDEDCFVYFYLGEAASKYFENECPNYLTAYKYINDLESRFNVNINWIDVSYLFDNNQFNFDKTDMETILFYLKIAYKNSIEKIIKENDN